MEKIQLAGEDGVFWDNVFSEFAGRIESVSCGIVRDKRLDLNNGQQREWLQREHIATQFINSPKRAFDEAIDHHSFWIMRNKASCALESITAGDTTKEAFFIDLGCGFGWHWIDLARKFKSVKFLLIDFSITNLKICRSLFPFKEYPNVLCLCCDIADIPVYTGVSDFCWSVQALQLLPPQKRKTALAEINRIQKKGAGLYIALLRCAPLIRLIYFIFGKKYHYKGYLENGVFLQRFDKEIASDLNNYFAISRLRYSEALFQKDLKITYRSLLIAKIDLVLSKTFLAPLFARQVEIWGRNKGK